MDKKEKTVKYDHVGIEKKWQSAWEKEKVYKTAEDGKNPKCFVLDMFPYPSGDGLHVGHPRGYIATDVYSRFKRMNGFNVLHPMGWDAFGLPAENYAIKNKISPDVAMSMNVKRFKKQLEIIGLDYDWSREIDTTDPKYYKWTQWIFLQMFKKGLAYESFAPINWCPSCKTGLANEDVENGKCERCGTTVEKKPMKQWVLKIREYADRLLDDLDELAWPEHIKESQRNWIGRSEGAMINFNLKNQSVRNCIIVHGSNSSEKEAKEGKPENLRHWKPWLKSELEKVGIETSNELYPEDWLPNYDKWKKVFEKNKIDENTVLVGHSAGTAFILRWLTENKKKVNKVVLVAPSIIKDGKYFKESKLKDFEFNSGLKNYFNKLIILYSDNDDEDIVESAKQIHSKLDGELIDMKNMGHFCYGDMGTEKFPELFEAIIESIKVFTTRPDTLFGLSYVVIAPENNLVDELKPQIKNWPEIEKYRKEVKDRSEIERTAQGKEKTGVVLSGIKAVNPVNKEEVPVFIADYVLANYGTGAVMAVPAHDERDYAFAKKYRLPMKRVIKPNVITTEVFIDPVGTNRNMTEEIKKKEQNLELFKEIYTGKDGIMFNSEKFNGMTNEEAMKPITEYAGGKMTKTYKLQDWVFSRQRYWGEPIPVIHCEKCGVVPVPEKDLPVKLPKVKFYEPTGTGESPLAAITDWVNTKCPKCGGMGKRETNTMPQWAGSSWYYLRYIDPNNDKALVDKEKERYWSPVDMYVGGTEHATRHLIYARFWHKFLYDIGAVSQKEPFKQLRNQGMILGSDNRKMSKRWGNVVNPDEVVKNVGADTLRVYESFMGPFEQEIAWSTDSMVGSRRFLDRVWNLQSRVQDGFADKDEITILLNKTIKKVGEDISSFNANTAISSMMILTNALEAEEKIGKEAYLKFIKILSPFAPHISEEIWSNLGNKKMIVTESWPKYDESKLVSSKVKMVVQVNGRVRGIIIMSNDSSEGEVEKMALSDENIVKWIDDKQITKRIFVKNKIINFVTE